MTNENNEVVDTDSIVDAGDFSENVETQVVGFFTGLNTGFIATVAGGEQSTEMIVMFVLAALGVRQSNGEKLGPIKKAPEVAIVGLAIGLVAGVVVKDPQSILDYIPV